MIPLDGISGIVLLAGGGAQRLGQDKISARIGATSVVEMLLADLDQVLPKTPLVLVGPQRATIRPRAWVQESPAGGGPVAGLNAGLQHLTTTPAPQDRGWLLVLAADQPFAGLGIPQLCAGSSPDAGANIGFDSTDRPQPLYALYQLSQLRSVLQKIPTRGASMRALIQEFTAHCVRLDWLFLVDVDTEADLRLAHHLAAAQPPT